MAALSYNLADCGSDGAVLDILENDKDSIVSNHRVLSGYISLELIVEAIMLVLKKEWMLLIDFSARHLLEHNRCSLFCKNNIDTEDSLSAQEEQPYNHSMEI